MSPSDNTDARSASRDKNVNADRTLPETADDDSGSDLERFLAEEDQAPRDSVVDPVEAAACVLVMRALESMPHLRADIAAGPVAVVVEVPGADWVHPVADVWRVFVHGTDAPPLDGDGVENRFMRRKLSRAVWFEFRRDGSNRMHRPQHGNAGVSVALSAGRPVYGFSPAPERFLPRDLLRVADHRVVVPALDMDALTDTVELVTRQKPTETFPEQLCHALPVSDLRLACRPGQNADAYLRRLRGLVDGKGQKVSLTLDDLHGMGEAVAWGRALARDLADYRRGALPWGAVDRGALLSGPPGTGKTTFARALANTCEVPLIAGSLSQWQAAGHLGDLLKAMRATFEEARKASPCIFFVDEVDSFGDRDTFSQEHRDYSIQVVNGFLEEIDGIGGREGVVIVGACNNPHWLDPAIKRSGRLDREIRIPLPSQEALLGIFRHHLGSDLQGVDLSGAALLALGATGADAERWVRGARRRARHGGRAMTLDDLLAEIRGSTRRRSAAHLRRCAVHEAGHTVVLLVECPNALLKVSINQTEETGGGVLSFGSDEEITRDRLLGRLRVALGGRAAEEAILGAPSTSAGGDRGSDLAKATALASALIGAFGFDEQEGLLWLGLPTLGNVDRMLASRPALGERAKALLSDVYGETKKIVMEHRAAVEEIAAALLRTETIGADDVRAIWRRYDTRGANST